MRAPSQRGPAGGPDRGLVLALYRLGFAALTIVAIAAQAVDLSDRGVLNPVNYGSYFTIQSNLIGAAVLLVAASRRSAPRSALLDLVRGGATVYLTVTFVVFALLLSGTDVDTAIPWVNTVLHGIFPVVVFADWLLDPPPVLIPFARSLWWLAYPLAWTAYTLVRGAVAGWYPYPFLDPANGGYGSVAAYVVAIIGFGIVLCAVIASIGNALAGRRIQVAPGG